MDLPASLSVALSERYEILREPGTGGMATVYLAADVKPARELVVSVLRAELQSFSTASSAQRTSASAGIP